MFQFCVLGLAGLFFPTPLIESHTKQSPRKGKSFLKKTTEYHGGTPWYHSNNDAFLHRFETANSKQNLENWEHQTPTSDAASQSCFFCRRGLRSNWSKNSRLVRDREAIDEPPNVATSPCHVSCPLPACRTSVRFCLDWTLYRRVNSTYVYIYIYKTMMNYDFFFCAKMALDRTKPLRDCHLWGRGWLAVDRRF